MSVQLALSFIRQVRQDEALRRDLAPLDDEASLSRLIEVAAAAGFCFTEEELQSAHKHDWAMRRARYGAANTSIRDAE